MLDAFAPDKSIAEMYVQPLLVEGILSVTKDHIKVMNLTIPRERMAYFHTALCQVRMVTDQISQGERGYTITKVNLAKGNDVTVGFKIESNVSGEGSILLTKKLAWELWEVLAFFVKVPLDKPTEQE